MTLDDVLGELDAFLDSRGCSPSRRRLFDSILCNHILPALARVTITVRQARDGLGSIIATARASRPNEQAAVRSFHNYLVSAPDSLSCITALEHYLAGRRHRRDPPYAAALRALLGRIVRDVPVVVVTCERLDAVAAAVRQEGNHHRTAALHHFLDLLAARRLTRAHESAPSPWRATLRRYLAYLDSDPDFDGALGAYMRVLLTERQLSETYVISVLRRLLDLVRFARGSGRASWAAITSADLVRFRDEALQRGVRTFIKTQSAIRCFFRFLVQTHLVSSDPSDGIRVKVASRAPRRVLARDEVHALLGAPAREIDRLVLSSPRHRRQIYIAIRDRAILALLAEAGLRPIELRRIDVDDLDMATGVVLITGKGSRFTPSRERRAYVESPACVAALRAYLAVRPLGPAKALFLSARGQPLGHHGLKDLVQRRARQAGITRLISPSTLRTTFASRLVANGADPFALRVLMGHDEVHTTLRLYTALSLEHVRETWQKTNPLARANDEPGEGGV